MDNNDKLLIWLFGIAVTGFIVIPVTLTIVADVLKAVL